MAAEVAGKTKEAIWLVNLRNKLDAFQAEAKTDLERDQRLSEKLPSSDSSASDGKGQRGKKRGGDKRGPRSGGDKRGPRSDRKGHRGESGSSNDDDKAETTMFIINLQT